MATQEPLEKFNRLQKMKYYQSLAESLQAGGYDLTEDEKAVISQWASINAKIMENEKLFRLAQEVGEGVPYGTYPTYGSSTCCNFAGCKLEE